jgi:hypothetical protein
MNRYYPSGNVKHPATYSELLKTVEQQTDELNQLRHDYKRLLSIVESIPQIVRLVTLDCGVEQCDQPTIYHRGNKWRYHCERAGNDWADGETPLAAVEAVCREPD